VGDQRIEKERCGRLGMRNVGVARFGRKGMRRQPVEQLGAVAGDDVDLRAVHVRVDEAGQHEPAAVVVPFPALAGRFGLDAGDAAGIDQQPVIRAKAHRDGIAIAPGRLAGEIEQIAADGDARRCAHAVRLGMACPARLRATPRTCSRSHFADADACVTSCQSW
jgi:hypothetical protein